MLSCVPDSRLYSPNSRRSWRERLRCSGPFPIRRVPPRQIPRSRRLGISVLTPVSRFFESARSRSWPSIVVGRNSHFHDLTKEEHDELGGVEYRALRVLFWIVLLVGSFRTAGNLTDLFAVLHLLSSLCFHHRRAVHRSERLPRCFQSSISLRTGILVLGLPGSLGVLEYRHVIVRSIDGAIPNGIRYDCR